MRFRVRTKLLLLICIPLSVTYTLMLGGDYFAARARAKQTAEDLVLGRANLSVSLLDARMNQVRQLASTIGDALQQRQEKLDPILRLRVMAMFRQFESVVGVVIALQPDAANPERQNCAVVTRAPGAINAPDAAAIDYLSPTCTWYQAARQTEKGLWCSKDESAGIFPTPTISYSMPILQDGQFRGVISIHVNVGIFRWVRTPRGRNPIPEAAMTPSTAAVAGGNLFNLSSDQYLIARQQGEVLFHWPEQIPAPSSLLEPSFKPVIEPLMKAYDASAETRAEILLVRTGNAQVFTFKADSNYFVTLVPFHGGEFFYVTGYSESELLGPVYDQLKQRATFLFAGMLALLAIIYLAARRISLPLEELDHAVLAVGKGDLDVRVPEHRGTDEISELSRLFNHMLRRIRKQMQTIREDAEARARVESELALARRIQTDLLPRQIPASPDRRFELHAVNLPANHVAGDFYDFFLDSSGRLTLVIADVAGHGMAAAMMMAVTRTIVRNLAGPDQRPAEILRRTNQALTRDQSQGMFVTLVLASYQPQTGLLTCANAGHPYPLLLRRDGSVQTLAQSTSPLLGVEDFDASEFSQSDLTLEPGDTFILYTDGIPEAHKPDSSDMFGHSRLEDLCRDQQSTPLSTLEKAIVCAVQDHQAGPLSDDLTLLLLRRL